MTSTTIADIELEVEDRGLAHLPTDEIVLYLVSEALKSWKADYNSIGELLWDEKIDDKQGEKMRDQAAELTGDYIAAVHQWAKGGTK